MKSSLESQLTTPQAQALYQALAELKDAQAVAALLRDVLTMEELTEAVRRFEVAGMLQDGKTFRQIAAAVKTSTATVARVNYWLNNGMGGYRAALAEHHHGEGGSSRTEA